MRRLKRTVHQREEEQQQHADSGEGHQNPPERPREHVAEYDPELLNRQLGLRPDPEGLLPLVLMRSKAKAGFHFLHPLNPSHQIKHAFALVLVGHHALQNDHALMHLEG